MNKYGIVITILAALLVGSIVYICCDKFNKSEKCNCTGCCNCKPEEDEDFKLIAETTTDDTYYRAELLKLGNVYESQWDKRYFGDAHPNCNHIGEVFGNGSDCNSH